MGNGEAKELICTTHGHDLRGKGLLERMGEKIQRIRSINGKYKIDRGMLKVVWEMEKPKNLCV